MKDLDGAALLPYFLVSVQAVAIAYEYCVEPLPDARRPVALVIGRAVMCVRHVCMYYSRPLYYYG